MNQKQVIAVMIEEQNKKTLNDDPKIHECNRSIPFWLILVYLAVTLWGIYYVTAFWTGE